jgi:hypothetical protein
VGTVVSTAGTDRVVVVVAGAQRAVPMEAVEVEALVAVPTEAEAPVRPVRAAALPRAAGVEVIARSMVVARTALPSTYS